MNDGDRGSNRGDTENVTGDIGGDMVGDLGGDGGGECIGERGANVGLRLSGQRAARSNKMSVKKCVPKGLLWPMMMLLLTPVMSSISLNTAALASWSADSSNEALAKGL